MPQHGPGNFSEEKAQKIRNSRGAKITISELNKQNSAFVASCEEIEPYSQRLCLKIDAVPTVDRETSSDVLENVKEISAESDII